MTTSKAMADLRLLALASAMALALPPATSVAGSNLQFSAGAAKTYVVLYRQNGVSRERKVVRCTPRNPVVPVTFGWDGQPISDSPGVSTNDDIKRTTPPPPP